MQASAARQKSCDICILLMSGNHIYVHVYAWNMLKYPQNDHLKKGLKIKLNKCYVVSCTFHDTFNMKFLSEWH